MPRRRARSPGGRWWSYNEYDFSSDMLGPFGSSSAARSAAKRKWPDAEYDEIKVTRKGPTTSEKTGLWAQIVSLFK